MTELTLAGKLAAASLDVGGKLNPDKRNKDQNYDYLSADKILSIGGQALAQQGVVIIPDIAAQEVTRLEYTDQYGKTKTRYDCRVDFLFHIHDGTTEFIQKWYGMGSDYSVPDKAMYKAITSGHKYFLMKLLCVGAGNEDGEHEDDEPKKQAPKVQPAQVTKVSPPPAVTITPREAEIIGELIPEEQPAPSTIDAWKMTEDTHTPYADIDSTKLTFRLNAIVKRNQPGDKPRIEYIRNILQTRHEAENK
jgi:hypothetical protein